MKPPIYLGVALASLALSLGQARADNLVSNGGFETGDFSGWTAQGNYLLVADTSKPGMPPIGSYGPHGGTYYAALGSTGNGGTLSQALATTAGQNYTVSFYVAGDGSTPNSLGVTWGGQTLLAPTALGNQNYNLYTYMVTATSPVTTLAFQEKDLSGYLSLDDVSVTSIPTMATAPEPASVTLLVIGALGVAGYRARRRRAKQAS